MYDCDSHKSVGNRMLPELVFLLLRTKNRLVLVLTLFMKCNFLSMFWEGLDAKFYTFFFFFLSLHSNEPIKTIFMLTFLVSAELSFFSEVTF